MEITELPSYCEEDS